MESQSVVDLLLPSHRFILPARVKEHGFGSRSWMERMDRKLSADEERLIRAWMSLSLPCLDVGLLVRVSELCREDWRLSLLKARPRRGMARVLSRRDTPGRGISAKPGR